MTTNIRWGILATGWIARTFTRDLLLTGHNVAAVGSRSQASADTFAAQFSLPRAHASYEALSADPDVDAVYIASPHPQHAANARLMLKAGKHVLIEKPFALNAREAQELVDLAEAKGLVVLEAMWTRFLPHMVRLREIIAAGAIGTVRSVIAEHTMALPEDPGHRINDLALGGGAFMDLGIYSVSFAHDILGAPESIQSTARFKATGVDAQVATMCSHAGGATSFTLSASDTGGQNGARILGTRGHIEIAGNWCQPTSFQVFNADGVPVDAFSAEVTGRGMYFQADEMERLIGAGQIAGDIMPPSATVAVLRTMDVVRGQIGLRYPGECR